ncbi:MAG: heavy-metal-associated domain-containing protein [Microbacteriaceae bacterium]|nr:heavy-metal-associated domain-containing protein [Microbacteriaceae bacterium]
MSTTDFGVTGLTCNHCVMTVSRAVALVPGVTGVSIDLVANGESTLHVESDNPVDTDSLDAAIVDAGYELVH